MSVDNWLRAAVTLTAVWLLSLVVLAFAAANPVTLNVEQIRQADYVALAAVVDVAQGKVHVEREWKRGRALGNIVVEDLNETSARAGERYILPLERIREDRYQLSRTGLPGEPGLIYPAEPEARSQLEALLGLPRQ